MLILTMTSPVVVFALNVIFLYRIWSYIMLFKTLLLLLSLSISDNKIDSTEERNQKIIQFNFKPKPYWDYDQDIDYQWSVIEEDIDVFRACRENKCSDGGEQTVCRPHRQVAKRCKNFIPLPNNFEIKKHFVIGHNVLRNRVAKSPLYVKNMNYLVPDVWEVVLLRKKRP